MKVKGLIGVGGARTWGWEGLGEGERGVGRAGGREGVGEGRHWGQEAVGQQGYGACVTDGLHGSGLFDAHEGKHPRCKLLHIKHNRAWEGEGRRASERERGREGEGEGGRRGREGVTLGVGQESEGTWSGLPANQGPAWNTQNTPWHLGAQQRFVELLALPNPDTPSQRTSLK